MSIVRMGMSEDGKFGNGYDAIFGKKPAKAKAADKPPAKGEKKPDEKKSDKKK